MLKATVIALSKCRLFITQLVGTRLFPVVFCNLLFITQLAGPLPLAQASEDGNSVSRPKGGGHRAIPATDQPVSLPRQALRPTLRLSQIYMGST